MAIFLTKVADFYIVKERTESDPYNQVGQNLRLYESWNRMSQAAVGHRSITGEAVKRNSRLSRFRVDL